MLRDPCTLTRLEFVKMCYFFAHVWNSTLVKLNVSIWFGFNPQTKFNSNSTLGKWVSKISYFVQITHPVGTGAVARVHNATVYVYLADPRLPSICQCPARVTGLRWGVDPNQPCAVEVDERWSATGEGHGGQAVGTDAGCLENMMMSSNGSIFRVTGHLCGEFTGEFTAQRPVTRSFDVFFDVRKTIE